MWEITFTKQFAKDLARLPASVRNRVETLVAGNAIRENPRLDGRAVKMQGYDLYYRLRVGDYRVGFRIDDTAQTVKLLRVLHRREIYRRFP